MKKIWQKILVLLRIKPKSYGGLSTFLPYISPTPNCAVCQWIGAEYPESLEATLDTTTEPLQISDNAPLISAPIHYDCLAQGGADACMCWNNEECKLLFFDRTRTPQSRHVDWDELLTPPTPEPK